MDYYTSKFTLARGLIFLGLIITIALAASPEFQKSPVLYITQIDATHFLDITVGVYGDGLGVPLDSLQFVLKEDDVEQDITAQKMEPAGIQVAFVLDDHLMTDMAIPVQAVKRLEMSGQLSPATDWISAFEMIDGGVVEERKPWTPDIHNIAGSLGRYRPTEEKSDTNLFDSLAYVINQFEAATLPATVQKSVILFSAGEDTHSIRTYARRIIDD